MQKPVSDDLIAIAGAVIQLQERREEADYDLETDISFESAKACWVLAMGTFNCWEQVQTDPNTLVSLILTDRSNRRG